MSQETLMFNIGGSVFETYRSTLLKLPHSPLAIEAFMATHHREEKNDYFFDRDPDMFKVVLNYLRTGELHIPPNICGPSAMAELKFWGIPPHEISGCCSSSFNDWGCTIETMITLEQHRKGSIQTGLEGNTQQTMAKIWDVLSNPSSSKAALVYGCSSYFVILVYIISIVVPFSGRDFVTYEAEYQTTGDLYELVEDNFNILNFPIAKACSDVNMVCVIVLAIEYVVRFLFAPARCRFLIMPLNLMDIFAFIPDILMHAPGHEIDVGFGFQMFRIFRFFRLIKHTSGLWVFAYTLKSSVKDFAYFIWAMFIGQILFAAFLYKLESTHEASHFASFPDALWFAIITMTTVGYGDMRPITWPGKCLASLCAVTGISVVIVFLSAIIRNYSYWHKRVQRALNAEIIAKRKIENTSGETQI